MEITSQEHAKQVIAGIPNNEYGDVGSAEREEAMNALRAYRNSTLQPPPVPENGVDDVVSDVEVPTPSLARGAGLTARGLVQGVAGLGGIVSDPFSILLNLGLEASGVPDKYRFSPNLRQDVSQQLTGVGLPVPETRSERIMTAAAEGAGGAGAITKIATLPQVVARSPFLAKILSSPYEVFGAGAAGGGSQYAAEEGYGPVGQGIAGIVTAIALPTVAGASMGILNLLRYFTSTSTAYRVGRRLTQQATEPEAAMTRLEADDLEMVPGSEPTTGVSSQDIGLLQAEAIMRSVNPSLFGVRLSQQNAARRAYIESQVDELGDPAVTRAHRKEVTTPMREEALAKGTTVEVQPVMDRIAGILQSARGERDSVKAALPWVRARLREIKRKGTSNEADRLYALRQDISDVLNGTTGDPTKSGWKLAATQLRNVRNSLDDAIEEVAPGYKAYLAEYRQLSQRASQAERLTEMRDRGSVVGIDPITGQEMLSQARFKNLVIGESGSTGMSRVLTDDQLTVMTRISDDLDRAMTITSPMVKAAGSDTARNTMAQAVGSVVRGVLSSSRGMRLAGESLSWIGRLTKGQQNDLMVEAMLDPKLAAMLMRDATRRESIRTSRALWDKFVSLGMGSLVGMAASEDPSAVREREAIENQVAELAPAVPELE